MLATTAASSLPFFFYRIISYSECLNIPVVGETHVISICEVTSNVPPIPSLLHSVALSGLLKGIVQLIKAF